MVENLQHWRKINPMLGSQLTSALENVSEGNWLYAYGERWIPYANELIITQLQPNVHVSMLSGVYNYVHEI